MLTRICNWSIATLSLITLVLSITLLGECIGPSLSHNMCNIDISWKVFWLGSVLLVLSLIGLIGSCYRVTQVLFWYLCIMVISIVVITVIWISASLAVNKGGSSRVQNDYYRLENFSDLLQSIVHDKLQWSNIKFCLAEQTMDCSYPAKQFSLGIGQKEHDVRLMESEPISWGCCKPPINCGFEQKDDTNIWNVPNSSFVSPNLDCDKWDNALYAQCYDCYTCKIGVLIEFQKDYNNFNLLTIVLLIFLIVNFSISICAFKTNQSADRYTKYRQEMVKKACNPTYTQAHLS